jgi:hypothetical protein
MQLVHPFRSLSPFARAAIVLEVLLGLGAVAGGAALMIGRRGEILPLPLSALEGSPFTDYFAPGLILFTVLGLGSLLVAFLAWRANAWAPILTVTVGGALLIWLLVEIAVVGYSNDPPLQPFYLALGVMITLLGVGWFAQTGVPIGGSRASRAPH